MNRPDGLAAAIARSGDSLLRSSVANQAVPEAAGALNLLAALDLGAGRSVCVVTDQVGRRWTVPVVDEGASVRRARAGDGVAAGLIARMAGEGTVDAPFAVR